MDKDVEPQSSPDQPNRGVGDFAGLFTQLEQHDAVAPIEDGLLRLLGTINAARRDRRHPH